MIQLNTIKFTSKDLIKINLATHNQTKNYNELIRRNHENQWKIRSPISPKLFKIVTKYFLSSLSRINSLPPKNLHLFLFKVAKNMSEFRITMIALGCIAIVMLYHHTHDESIAIARNSGEKAWFLPFSSCFF